MFETILALVSPILVSALTSFAKWVRPALLKVHNGWIIALVAVLSYFVAILNSILSGQPVDPTSIHILSDTLINLLASTGVYIFGKKLVGTA